MSRPEGPGLPPGRQPGIRGCLPLSPALRRVSGALVEGGGLSFIGWGTPIRTRAFVSPTSSSYSVAPPSGLGRAATQTRRPRAFHPGWLSELSSAPPGIPQARVDRLVSCLSPAAHRRNWITYVYSGRHPLPIGLCSAWRPHPIRRDSNPHRSPRPGARLPTPETRMG